MKFIQEGGIWGNEKIHSFDLTAAKALTKMFPLISEINLQNFRLLRQVPLLLLCY